MAWLDGVLHFFGFAVCHTLPSRTIVLGGKYLPLCARCTGIYLGIALSYIYLVARRGFRVNALPPLGVSFVLAALLLPMAVDGVTSYAGLRASNNVIRLATGMAAGAALPMFAFPLLSPTLVMAETPGRPVIRPFGPWYDYVIWAATLAGGAALALGAPAPLYYPFAVAAVLGLLAVFFNLALVIWEMALEKAGRWGRRPITFIWAAFTVAALFVGLHYFHQVTFTALMNATGGKLPT